MFTARPGQKFSDGIFLSEDGSLLRSRCFVEMLWVWLTQWHPGTFPVSHFPSLDTLSHSPVSTVASSISKASPDPKKHMNKNKSSSGLQFSDTPSKNGAEQHMWQLGKQQGGWGPPAESPGASTEALTFLSPRCFTDLCNSCPGTTG